MVSSKEKIKIFIHQLWFELEQNEDAWNKVYKYGSARSYVQNYVKFKRGIKMTKKELADVIHVKIGLSIRESAEIVEFFFNLVKEKLAKGEGVQIRGFGSFGLQKRKAKKGRNPATGEAIVIADRTLVTFKPSRILRDSINEIPVSE